MEEVESLASDQHEVEDETGEIKTVAGGVRAEEVERSVRADPQLALNRKKHEYKFKVMVMRQVSSGLMTTR